jgi:hypothetical protein
MSFVQKDTEAVAKRSGKPQIFRNTIFVELVSRLVLNPNFNEVLLDAWREKYLYKYDDVRYFALINIKYVNFWFSPPSSRLTTLS